MPHDPFAQTVDSPIAPATHCFAISPNDTEDLDRVTKAIYVGAGGDVALVAAAGEAPVVFQNVASGAILDVRVRAVKATGTTASGIVGLS